MSKKIKVKIFWIQKNLYPKIFFNQNNFGSKKVWGCTKFLLVKLKIRFGLIFGSIFGAILGSIVGSIFRKMALQESFVGMGAKNSLSFCFHSSAYSISGQSYLERAGLKNILGGETAGWG